MNSTPLNRSKTSKLLGILCLLSAIIISGALARGQELTNTLTPGWRMLAIPDNADTPVNPCEIFGTGKVLRLSGSQYLECDQISEWKPGDAYWVFVEEETEYKVSSRTALSIYNTDLQPGWNQVGIPYDYSITVADSAYIDGVPIKTSDAIRPFLFGYDTDSGTYYEARYMYPGEGYLLYSHRVSSLRIIPVPGEGEPGPTVEIFIVSTEGEGATETGALDLNTGEAVTLWAAGFDSRMRFTGNLPVVWSVSDGLTGSGSTPSSSFVFIPSVGDTGGTVSATSDSLTDSTGQIIVIGSDEIFSYPLTGASELAYDSANDLYYVADQVIAAFTAGTTEAQAKSVIEALGGKVVGRNSDSDLYQVKISSGTDLTAFQSALANSAGVTAVSFNYILTNTAYPADPAFDVTADPLMKWAFDITGMATIWGSFTPISSPVVAVLDTGVSTTHADLASKISGGRNMLNNLDSANVTDETGHGTSVAGVIAATPDNNEGTAGFCPTCKIMPVKVCDASNNCPVFTVAAAITYAADNGADIINLSIGANLPAGDPAIDVLNLVANDANSKGALLVAAAGNNSTDAGAFYPAALPAVMSVGATDESDARASFSNFGSSVTIAAPGKNVYTTGVTVSYGYSEGTSISAAVVSGIAGLLYSIQEAPTPASIENLIVSNADAITTDYAIGGRINIANILSYLITTNNPPVITALTLSDDLGYTNSQVTVTAAASDPDGDAVSYSWSADGGTVSETTPGAAVWNLPATRGEYSVTVTASDYSGNTATDTVSMMVFEGEIKSISVTPAVSDILTGDIVQHTATCLDQAAVDGALPLDCTVAWSLQGNTGTLDSNGAFAATAEGNSTVFAQLGDASGTATIYVKPAGGSVLKPAANSTPCSSDDWLMPGCNTARTNQSSLQLVPPLSYRANYHSAPSSGIHAAPLAFNDKVFVIAPITDLTSILYKIDHTTAAMEWEMPLPSFPLNSPVMDPTGQYLYTALKNGDICKVDISTSPGTIVWTWRPGPGIYEFQGSVALDGNTLYAATNTDNGLGRWGRIYAVQDNGATAVTKWQYPPAGGDATVTPVLTGGPTRGYLDVSPLFTNVGGTDIVLAGNTNGELIVLRADNGKQINRFFTTNSDGMNNIYISMTIVGDYVFTTGGDATFRKFHPITGPVWTTPVQINISQAPAAYNVNTGVFFIPTNEGYVYAVEDNGTSGSIKWKTPSTALLEGSALSQPVLYQGGGTLSTGGTAPAGLLVSTTNAGRLYAIEQETGNRLWRVETPNINSSPIILPFGTEVEACVGMADRKLHFLEKNFAPEIVFKEIVEAPTDDVGMIPGATDIATARIYVYDKNGLDDIDGNKVFIDASPLGGNSQLLLMKNTTLTYNGQTVAEYKNQPPTIYPITVPRGFPAGYQDLRVSVTDRGGVTSYATASLLVADTPAQFVSAVFNPDSIYPDQIESTDVTVVIQDPNIVTGATNTTQMVSLNIDPLRGATGVENWLPLTCGNGYTDGTNQLMECTYSGLTANFDTAVVTHNMLFKAEDSGGNIATITVPLTITGAEYFTLDAAPNDPDTGASSTITMKAFSAAGQIMQYDNYATITISMNNGTAATISYSGANIVDNGDGTASLSPNAFSGGQTVFAITNTTAESGVTVTGTDAFGANGTSNPIGWIPRGLYVLDVQWTPIELVKTYAATVVVTAYDGFNNIITSYTNPNGMQISFNTAPTDPAGLSYAHATVGAITDNGDGTASLSAGNFTNGVMQFQVTNQNADANMVFTVEETTVAVSGDSNGITWLPGIIGSFTLEQVNPVLPTQPEAGATATVRITAYDSETPAAVFSEYNNIADIDISLAGTIPAIRLEGTGLTDNGDGTATLAGTASGGGHFSNGTYEFQIYNIMVETVAINMTENDRTPKKTGSTNVTWKPGPLDYFSLSPSITDMLVGASTTITITAYDAFHNIKTDYDASPGGARIFQSQGAAGTGFVWYGTDITPSGTSNPPNYDAQVTSGGTTFASGVATVDVMSTKTAYGVTVKILDNTFGFNGTSSPITWRPGPIGSFTISASPTTVTAGATTTATITAYDIYNNIKDDFTSNVNLNVTSGTAASLMWSGPGTTSWGATALLAGNRFASGVATAAIADTKAEGPVFLRVSYGASSGTSQVANSPTWIPGPLAKIIIRDTANNGGSEFGAYSMPVGESFTVWSAGYDQYDNYISDVAADWYTIPTPDLDFFNSSSSTSFTFTPVTAYTEGILRAQSGTIYDDTGLIEVQSPKPNPPVLSTANEVDQVRLTWTPPSTYIDGLSIDPSILRYKVFRSDVSGGPYTEIATTDFATTTYIDTSVTTWVTYYYVIWAENPAIPVESAYSNEELGASIGVPYNFEKSCALQDPYVYHPPDYPSYVNRPRGLVTDGTNVYVADTDNHRISLFLESDCSFIENWGEFGFSDGQFKSPDGIVISGGSVFVADIVDRIQKFDMSGTFVQSTSLIAGALKMTDGGGAFYVSSYNGMIRKVNSESLVEFATESFFATSPTGVVFNPSDGNIYVSNSADNVIKVYNTSGAVVKTIGEPGTLYGQLSNPQGLTVDSAGNIVVADTDNHRVQIFDTSGDLVNVIGGFGYGNELLRYPEGVAISPSGNLWVADTRNNRIGEFSPP